MGIHFQTSWWEDSYEFDILPTSDPIREGMLLAKMLDPADGHMKVYVPSGTNTEIFAGVALAQRRADTSVPVVEQITFPAVVAPATTVAASISSPALAPTTDVVVVATDGSQVMILSEAAAVDVDSAGAGHFNATGNVITGLGSAWGGKTANVIYRRDITVNDYDRLYADPFAGLTAQELLDRIGVMITGCVFTSYFATGDNWMGFGSNLTTNPLRVGAGGLATMATGATGSVLLGPNAGDYGGSASVEQAPSVDIPFLGLRFTTT